MEPDRISSPSTPLVDAWRQARAAARRPMQVPGHKMRFTSGTAGWAYDPIGDTVRDDVPLQGGVDDNAYSHGYLTKAEELLGSRGRRGLQPVLLGGSSQGNIAALGTIGDQDVPIAIDRTSHRSTQAGLVLIGARPVWIYRLHLSFICRSAWRRPVSMRSPSRSTAFRHLALLHRNAVGRRRTCGIRPCPARTALHRPGMGRALGLPARSWCDSPGSRLRRHQRAQKPARLLADSRGEYARDDLARETLDRWVDLTSTTSPPGRCWRPSTARGQRWSGTDSTG